MTPTQLATLARAMGYEVEIDDTAGAGVVRVLIRDDSGKCPYPRRTVFRPHDDAAQAWDVLCWLLERSCVSIHMLKQCLAKGHIHVDRAHGEEDLQIQVNNTPADLRRAIVEAAVRVAEAL
jgi:hypothetical protein